MSCLGGRHGKQGEGLAGETFGTLEWTRCWITDALVRFDQSVCRAWLLQQTPQTGVLKGHFLLIIVEAEVPGAAVVGLW